MELLITLLSGVLTALPLLSSRLWLLSWFNLIPYFIVIITRCKSGKCGFRKAFLYGLVFGAGFYGVIYYWFTCLYPFDFLGFTKVEALLAVAGAWLGMTVLQSLSLALVPLLYRIFGVKNERIAPLLIACLYTLCEWLQTQSWLGVPWGRLALMQYACLPMIQLSSWFGSLFISFLIVLVNALFAVAFIRIKQKPKPNAFAFLAIAVMLGNYICGAALYLSYNDGGEPVTVTAVQGNIASGEKWEEGALDMSLERYTELAENAPQSQITVFPETVVTSSLRLSDRLSERFSSLAKKTNSMLIIGAFDKTDGKTYNALVSYNKNGELIGEPYYKRHLVPFGEYLPMRGFLEFVLPTFAGMNAFGSDLSAGDGTRVLETEYGKIGMLICFDSIYETLTTDSVRDGAELIVLATNDSWYRDSASVRQHNGHAVLRAVESGRYIIRAANTGISSIIAPTGKILESLPPLVSGTVTADVRFRSERTLYSYIGNIIVIFSAITPLIIFCCQKKGNKGRKR